MTMEFLAVIAVLALTVALGAAIVAVLQYRQAKRYARNARRRDRAARRNGWFSRWNKLAGTRRRKRLTYRPGDRSRDG